MSDRRFCPWCGTDQRGRDLTDEERASGAWGNTTHFSNTIGVEIRGVYDGALFWRCPGCGGSWHRWPANHPLHVKADQFVGAPSALQQATVEWIAANPPTYRFEPSLPDDPGEIRRRLEVLNAELAARTRVEIDPNVRVRGNQTRTGMRYVHGPIAVGDTVTVYEPEADLEGYGAITEIDYNKQLVWIWVNWASVQPRGESHG